MRTLLACSKAAAIPLPVEPEALSRLRNVLKMVLCLTLPCTNCCTQLLLNVLYAELGLLARVSTRDKKDFENASCCEHNSIRVSGCVVNVFHFSVSIACRVSIEDVIDFCATDTFRRATQFNTYIKQTRTPIQYINQTNMRSNSIHQSNKHAPPRTKFHRSWK